MLNIPYIATVYKINKISSLIENIDAPVLDINLALWDAEDSGLIKLDREKDTIEVLEFGRTLPNPELLAKLKEVIAWYNADGRAVNRNKLVSHTFSNSTRFDPPRQDFFCGLDWAVENGQIIAHEVEVELPAGKKGNRTKTAKFVVYSLPEYDAKEMVDNFIDDVKASRKKNKLDVE